jgi:heme-degrading monooxygenase HmoA
MTFAKLDSNVSIRPQLQTTGGPVVLINICHANETDKDGLLEAWARDAEFLESQPGFISAQLHEGIVGSCTFLNYAVWESSEVFRNAFENPEFQSRLTRYPASTVASPHLFRK